MAAGKTKTSLLTWNLGINLDTKWQSKTRFRNRFIFDTCRSWVN